MFFLFVVTSRYFKVTSVLVIIRQSLQEMNAFQIDQSNHVMLRFYVSAWNFVEFCSRQCQVMILAFIYSSDLVVITT